MGKELSELEFYININENLILNSYRISDLVLRQARAAVKVTVVA